MYVVTLKKIINLRNFKLNFAFKMLNWILSGGYFYLSANCEFSQRRVIFFYVLCFNRDFLSCRKSNKKIGSWLYTVVTVTVNIINKQFLVTLYFF